MPSNLDDQHRCIAYGRRVAASAPETAPSQPCPHPLSAMVCARFREEGPQWRDLRGRRVGGLCYPRRCLLLLGGLPGAGKSTLLYRLLGVSAWERGTVRTRAGVVVVDSQHARNRLAPWLDRLPYPWWRWVVHVVHYACTAAALRAEGPVVVHEPATRRATRWLLGRYARLTGRDVHIVLLDVDPWQARDGQRRRGRMVTPRSFRTHARRWRRLLTRETRSPARMVPGAVSVTVLDRSAAAALEYLRFSPPFRDPGHVTGDGTMQG